MAELFDTPAFERRLELARIRRAISLGNRAAEGTPAGDGARVLELAPGGPPVLLAVAEARPLPAPEVPEAVGAGRGRIAVIGVIFAAGLALGLGLAVFLA
ncbi:hypothetical protein, partial [Amaricoccus sp.]|uniref:hypothetical protein n=1 Tax=Amaricoccus sp. TaxID=1872485 RepID=UPI002C4169C1